VITDDTPPEWFMLYPANGGVYGTPILKIQVGASDAESLIVSIEAKIDGAVYPMTFTSGVPGYAVYTHTFLTPIVSGTHSLSYVATNGVGLKTNYTGTFSMSQAIAGIWFINGVQITSPTQKVYSQTLTVNFNFSKTAGNVVTCNVVEGSTPILTLTSTDSTNWHGSYTFTGGSHTVTLTASDGTTSVIMAMLSVDFGGVVLDFTTEQLVMFAAGACCLGGGGYLRLPKKKQ
jgi:hypothetical protein